MNMFYWLVSTGVRLSLILMGISLPLIFFFGIVKIVSQLDELLDCLNTRTPRSNSDLDDGQPRKQMGSFAQY